MTDKVAVVTGASQGIGRATAIRLAREFAAVALVARNERNLRDTERQVVDAGAHALVVPGDLSEAPMASAWRWRRPSPTKACPAASRSTACCQAR